MTGRTAAALAAATALVLLGAPAGAQDAPRTPSATSAPATPPPDAAAAAGVEAGPVPPLEVDVEAIDPFAAPSASAAGSGVDDLLRGPDLRKGNDPTFQERYGTGGYTIDNTLGFRDVTDKGLNALAGAVFGMVAALASGVTKLFQWAFSMDLFEHVGAPVTGIVASLRETLYAPFLQVFIVLAGVYGLWHGIVRRRGTMAAEGWVWAIVALVGATIFFSHPQAIVSGANGMSIGLSRAVLAGTSVVDPRIGPDDGVRTEPTFSGDRADDQLRVAADRFWRSFVYAPWQVMEFGSTAVGREYGERLLAAKTITVEETAQLAGDPDRTKALRDAKKDRYNAIKEELKANEPEAWEWFQGHRSVERVGVAVLAAAGVLLAGSLLLVLSGAVLLAQLAVLLLVLLGPLFLLVGIQPGTGRVIAVRWVETLVGALMKRVLLSTLLAVVLVASGVLLDATSGLGWGMAMALQVLVVLAAIVYRRPFARIFANAGMPAAIGGHSAEDRASMRPAVSRARSLASVAAAALPSYAASRAARAQDDENDADGESATTPVDWSSSRRRTSRPRRLPPSPPPDGVEPNATGRPMLPEAVAQRSRQRSEAWRRRSAQRDPADAGGDDAA